jgi:hypothetical protein
MTAPEAPSGYDGIAEIVEMQVAIAEREKANADALRARRAMSGEDRERARMDSITALYEGWDQQPPPDLTLEQWHRFVALAHTKSPYAQAALTMFLAGAPIEQALAEAFITLCESHDALMEKVTDLLAHQSIRTMVKP